MCDTNKKEKACGCKTSGDNKEKVCFHHLLKPLWPLLPEHLRDILHSLDMQKIAVLTELKEWADGKNQPELAHACALKIEKINKRLVTQEADRD